MKLRRAMQKIQCKFKQDIPDMGHLEGGSERDIKRDSKVQIPLWMAYILIYSNYADFAIPGPFVTRVQNALKAEPTSVKLSGLVGAGGLWYGFGRMLLSLLDDEHGDLMSALLARTFRQRLLEVVDQAQHFAALGHASGGHMNDATQSFREGLDATERELFGLVQESSRRTKRWYESGDKGRK